MFAAQDAWLTWNGWLSSTTRTVSNWKVLSFGFSILVTALLSALVAGAMVYCLLVIIAARRYLQQATPCAESFPPISVLTPLHGAEVGLEENLRSSFAQRYPRFELIFALRHSDDAASPIVHQLMAEFLHVPARVIITGEPPYPNAQVFSLHLMQGPITVFDGGGRRR